MSKALKWLEAEADRLEKEYIENDDPNKTVNHSFIEGFNYALVNLQAIEELELNDNQKIVLEWLKSNDYSLKLPTLAINQLDRTTDMKVRKAQWQLNKKQEFEVLAAFAQWGREQEKTQ